MRQSTEPSLMAATCSVLYVALERLKMLIFWEMTSQVISAFSAYLLDSDTCMASVFRVLGYFTYFPREGALGSSFLRSSLPSPMRKRPRSSLSTVIWPVLLVTLHLALSCGMCKAVSAVHAVFPLHGGRSKLFGIAVGMDQEDSFYVHTPAVFTGTVLGRCSHARFGVRQWWLPVVRKAEGGPTRPMCSNPDGVFHTLASWRVANASTLGVPQPKLARVEAHNIKRSQTA